MNEIEKLIAKLPRPAPSMELDRRVMNALQTVSPIESQRPTRWRSVRPFLIATCAGLVGFVIGRQSLSVPSADSAVANITLGPATSINEALQVDIHHPAPPMSSVERDDLGEKEALARFLMPPGKSEGLFGSGLRQGSTESAYFD